MRIGVHALLVLLGLWASPLPAAADTIAAKAPPGGVRFAYVVYVIGEESGDPRALLSEDPMVTKGRWRW